MKYRYIYVLPLALLCIILKLYYYGIHTIHTIFSQIKIHISIIISGSFVCELYVTDVTKEF